MNDTTSSTTSSLNIEHCPDCNEPTHPTCSDDDGRCEECSAKHWSKPTLYRYIATTDINNEPTPFTGLLCVVLNRFGMSYAGFDCCIAFVDKGAFLNRAKLAGNPLHWYEDMGEMFGWDDATIEAAAGRPCFEANFEEELEEALTPGDKGIIQAVLDTCHDIGDDDATDTLTTALVDAGVGNHELAYYIIHTLKRSL